MGAETDEATQAQTPPPLKENKPWPEPKILEKWLMLTTKETDPGALFLRRMLQMNPAYGSYLSSNEDLAQLVIAAAKKVRSKVNSVSGPVSPTALYEPLLALAWRVIGQIFHSIIHMQKNQDLPVPQMALGQIKMLIHTNEELSQQLKEARRAYLRELVFLREKNRTISAKAQRAVASLQDEPIMFYEPLSYVLDDATKDFVREVVEERMKLELRTHVPAEDEREEDHVEDLQQDLKALQSENRNLKTEVARVIERAKKAEVEVAKTKEELSHLKRLYSLCQADLGAARKERDQRKSDVDRTTTIVQEVDRPREVVRTKSVDNTELKDALEAEQAKVAELEEKVAKLEAEKLGQQEELDALYKALRQAQDNKQKVVETIVKENVVTESITSGETQIVPVEHGEVDDLRRQIEKLQKALEAERAMPKKGKSTTVKQEIHDEVVVVKNKKGKGYTEAELQEEVNKVQAKFEKKVAKLEEEIERLKAELEGKDGKARKTSGNDGSEEARKWKRKYEELEEKHDDLTKRFEALEDKVRQLIEKLREYGGDKAVEECLKNIGLKAPPPKKKKESVFDRLYGDAMRRIETFRAREQALKEEEEKYLKKLKNALSGLGRPSVKAQVEKVADLHKAHVDSGNEYYDALAQITEEHAEILNAEETIASAIDKSDVVEYCEMCGQRIGLQSPEGLSSQTLLLTSPDTSFDQRPPSQTLLLTSQSSVFQTTPQQPPDGYQGWHVYDDHSVDAGDLASNSLLQSRRLLPSKSGPLARNGFSSIGAAVSERRTYPDLRVQGLAPAFVDDRGSLPWETWPRGPKSRSRSQERSRSPSVSGQSQDAARLRDVGPTESSQQTLVPKRRLIDDGLQPSSLSSAKVLTRTLSASALEPSIKGKENAKGTGTEERSHGNFVKNQPVWPDYSPNSSLTETSHSFSSTQHSLGAKAERAWQSDKHLPGGSSLTDKHLPALFGGAGIEKQAFSRSMPGVNGAAATPKRRHEPSPAALTYNRDLPPATLTKTRLESSGQKFFVTPVASQQSLAAGILPRSSDDNLRPVTR